MRVRSGTLSEISQSARAKVLKTWLNGWVTSSRMTEPELLNCLLGCEGKDDKLLHYLQCPRIYATAKFIASDTSDDPLIRCGLCCPSAHSLLIVSCIFTAYHAVKNSVRNGGLSSVSSDFNPNWCLFASSFHAEAVECRLVSTHFAQNAFQSFLSAAAPSGP